MLCGLYPSIVCQDGQTPFLIAAAVASAPIMEYLLEQRADCDTRDKVSSTGSSSDIPRRHVHNGNHWIVSTLEPFQDSATALHLAVQNQGDRSEGVEFLIASAADLEARDKVRPINQTR